MESLETVVQKIPNFFAIILGITIVIELTNDNRKKGFWKRVLGIALASSSYSSFVFLIQNTNLEIIDWLKLTLVIFVFIGLPTVWIFTNLTVKHLKNKT